VGSRRKSARRSMWAIWVVVSGCVAWRNGDNEGRATSKPSSGCAQSVTASLSRRSRWRSMKVTRRDSTAGALGTNALVGQREGDAAGSDARWSPKQGCVVAQLAHCRAQDETRRIGDLHTQRCDKCLPSRQTTSSDAERSGHRRRAIRTAWRAVEFAAKRSRANNDAATDSNAKALAGILRIIDGCGCDRTHASVTVPSRRPPRSGVSEDPCRHDRTGASCLQQQAMELIERA
jgi:hypothetical protein